MQSEQLPPAAARSNSRPSCVLCGSRAELACCVETTVGHNCAQQTGTHRYLSMSKRSLGNAPFLRASFFLAEKGTVWVRVSN